MKIVFIILFLLKSVSPHVFSNFLQHCHTPNHLCLKSRFNTKPCSNNYQIELILPLNLSRLSYFFSTILWKVSFALLFTHSPVSIFDHILETVFLEHNSNHVTPMLENLQKTLISHQTLLQYSNHIPPSPCNFVYPSPSREVTASSSELNSTWPRITTTHIYHHHPIEGQDPQSQSQRLIHLSVPQTLVKMQCT